MENPFGDIPDGKGTGYLNEIAVNNVAYRQNAVLVYNNKQYPLYFGDNKLNICKRNNDVKGQNGDITSKVATTNYIFLDELIEKKNDETLIQSLEENNKTLIQLLNDKFQYLEGTFQNEQGKPDIQWIILVLSGIIRKSVWGEDEPDAEAGPSGEGPSGEGPSGEGPSKAGSIEAGPSEIAITDRKGNKPIENIVKKTKVPVFVTEKKGADNAYDGSK